MPQNTTITLREMMTTTTTDTTTMAMTTKATTSNDDTAALSTENLQTQIREFKLMVKTQSPDYKSRFDEITVALKEDIKRIINTQHHQEESEGNKNVDEGASCSSSSSSSAAAIPQFDFHTIVKSNGFTQDQRQKIHQAGCCIIRNTLPSEEVMKYNDDLSNYIIDNGYYDNNEDQDHDESSDNNVVTTDQYFSQLESGKPQIFGIYWSKPQIWVRQHPNMALIRRYLNRLWTWRKKEEEEDEDDDSAEANDADNIDIDDKSTTIYFNPDMEITYADRIRRREPGDTSLGLSPHVDSGSIERWIEKNYQNVYHDVFFAGSTTTTSKKKKKDSSSSSWIYDYNPFHIGAQHRVDVQEFPSPAVCSVFRTFQGWVALTSQGGGDGTLQLLPSTLAMPYMLLRAIQDDVPEDDLCGAKPGRALTVSPKWHSILLDGLVSIPKVNPGDTVWWHPDTIHAVEDKHNGEGYSNVLYVGAVPDCNKNRQFLNKQKNAFLNGKSCPDFAPEHHECTYKGRATKHDLTELGRRQMGFQDSE